MAEGGVPASELGVIRHFGDVEWVDEAKFGRVSAEVAGAAQKAGARRKFLNRGDEGLYVQYSTMPPGFRVAPHVKPYSWPPGMTALSSGPRVSPVGSTVHPPRRM
jgi:hypothetical protein